MLLVVLVCINVSFLMYMDICSLLFFEVYILPQFLYEYAVIVQQRTFSAHDHPCRKV
jgi:hypothetical protein